MLLQFIQTKVNKNTEKKFLSMPKVEQVLRYSKKKKILIGWIVDAAMVNF